MDSLYDVIDVIPGSPTFGRSSHSTEASTGDATKAGGATTTKRSASSSDSNQIVVSKPCYDFFCKFRKNDLDKIRKGCTLDIVRRKDDFVEIRFVEARTGTCAEWEERFGDICDELKRAVVVERVDLLDVQNVNKMLNKLKNQAETLLVKKDKAVDIVCRREALDGIKDLIEKYKVKRAKQPLTLPVGYDVNGVFRLYIYVADITKLNVDVLVNVTDELFQSKAIIEAAGPEINRALREHIKQVKVKTSDVFSTAAGNLPCKAILHAVKPCWPDRADDALRNTFKKKLTTMIQNILSTATDKEGCESVAMSTSDFHVDDDVSEVVANAVKDAIIKTALIRRKSKLVEIHIVDNQEDVLMSLVGVLGDGGSLKVSYGKSVSIKTLPQDEMLAVVTAKNIEDSSDPGYTVVVKQKRLTTESEPLLPIRKVKPKTNQPTRQNRIAGYENVSPPIPRKNDSFVKELKTFTRKMSAETKTQASDSSAAAFREETNKIAKPEQAEEEMTMSLFEDEDEEDAAYLYDEVVLVDAAKAERTEKAGDGENLISVDKRYYNYLSKFRKKELDSLRKACHLHSKDIHEGIANVLEIRLSRNVTEATRDWQQQFMAKYEELKGELTIHQVALTELQNVKRLMNKLRSHSQVLLIKNKNQVDIVCRREALDGIKDLIEKYKVKKSKQPLTLPVGYDINGVFRLYIYVADITKLNVDVLVNVTDELLQSECVTSKAIIEAAGPEIDKELRDILSKTQYKTSEVLSTNAGNLPCKAVIHALLPKWPTTNQKAETKALRNTLKETFENIFMAVDKGRNRNLAIALDDSGTYPAPINFVVKAMVDVLLLVSSKCKKTTLKEVHVVNTTGGVLSVLLSQLQPEVLYKTTEGEKVTIRLLPASETQKLIASRTKDSSGQSKGLFGKRLKAKT